MKVWIGLALALVLVLAPVGVSVATGSPALDRLTTVIEGVISAGRDYYCATGVTQLCP